MYITLLAQSFIILYLYYIYNYKLINTYTIYMYLVRRGEGYYYLCHAKNYLSTKCHWLKHKKRKYFLNT